MTITSILFLCLLLNQNAVDDSYLDWTEKQATEIAKSMRASGRVRGTGRGILNTEKAISYKIRATWLTPEVIRATARLHQIKKRLTDEETKSLVARAEALADTAFIIEIDPDEGSGVIPTDWQAFLRATASKGEQGPTSYSDMTPSLGQEAALAGAFSRDYNYDIFWVKFPLCSKEGKYLFLDSDKQALLTVRIESKEGKVSFLIPESIKRTTKCN